MTNMILAAMLFVLGATFVALGAGLTTYCHDKIDSQKLIRGTFTYQFYRFGVVWGILDIMIGVLAIPLAILTMFFPL